MRDRVVIMPQNRSLDYIFITPKLIGVNDKYLILQTNMYQYILEKSSLNN